MGDVVTIKKDYDIKISSYIKTFLNPQYVFLPILDGFKLKVIDNTYVYKNDIVMMNKQGKTVHSSVSGKVLGVKNMLYYNNKNIPSIVIENDFKENIRMRKSARKYISDYKLKDFMELIEDTSIKSSDDYLFDKFKLEHKKLIVNGIELEPYMGNKYFILEKNYEEILETIDLLCTLFNYDRVVLAIKNNDSGIISNFASSIGTYPNIELKLTNDVFPIGNDTMLKNNLNMPDALVLSVNEIVGIYHILKKQTPVTEKLITISGNAVEPKEVVKVKMGSLLSEVFINNFDFTSKNVEVYLNGNMTGNIVSTLKYVIDEKIDGIIIMQKEELHTGDCINCGLCSKCCPMGLSPKYVFDHNGQVRSEYKDKCIGCGLCNYVCPSNIDLREKMKLGASSE